MMKLQRDSWTVRWAYMGDDVPYATSLCPLFWRIVLITPMKVAAILVIIISTVFVAASHWRFVLIGITTVGAIVGVYVGVSRLVSKRRGIPAYGEPSISSQMYRAIKDRVCPLVQIEP